MQRARVTAEHRLPERPPIRVAAGDTVTLGERDQDWPQFVWTTLAQGLGGWIPAVLFNRDVGEAIALDDYDTRELHADIGELLIVHRLQEEWWWAENARGECGWIPARSLQLLDDEPG